MQKYYAKTLKNTMQKQRKTQNLHKNKQIQDILQPTTRPRINISQVPAGWPVLLIFFIEGCLFVFVVILCLCVFAVFVSVCMYKRKSCSKNKKENLRGKHNKQTTNNNTGHPAGTWEIFIRGLVVGWMSCLCLCFLFSRRLFVVCCFRFLCCCCFLFVVAWSL